MSTSRVRPDLVLKVCRSTLVFNRGMGISMFNEICKMLFSNLSVFDLPGDSCDFIVIVHRSSFGMVNGRKQIFWTDFQSSWDEVCYVCVYQSYVLFGFSFVAGC